MDLPSDLPSEQSLRFIVSRYAALRAAHGEALGDPELLSPTGRHFPDEFNRDEASLRRLVDRMIAYAPLSEDLGYDVGVVEPDPAAAKGGGCGTGACGPGAEEPLGKVFERGDRYVVALARRECAHPILLAGALSRAVGSLILYEGGSDETGEDFAAVSEIAATLAGFGVLLLGGAAHYGKGCGGLTLHRVTALSASELSVALGLFLRVHGIKPSQARTHLETTQREAFDVALRWVDSNEALVKKLRTSPEELEDGLFRFAEPKGVLGRLFSKDKDRDVAPPDPGTFLPKQVARSEEERRRIAETRALVEEALREG